MAELSLAEEGGLHARLARLNQCRPSMLSWPTYRSALREVLSGRKRRRNWLEDPLPRKVLGEERECAKRGRKSLR